MLSRNICVVLTVILLLVIAAIFLAPSVDLEPSALRAVRAAVLFFFAILIAARLLIGVRYDFPLEWRAAHDEQPLGFSRPPGLKLLDLYCTRLC